MSSVHQGYFDSFDGRRLYYQFFQPLDAKKTLLIFHGHGEHSGRYEKFFGQLKDEGWQIGVFDFRGHGKSQGPEVYVESFEEYIQDANSFVQHMKTVHHIDTPVTLLGHSMGGLVSAYFALRSPEKIERLIFSSPCFGLALPKVLVAFNSLMRMLFPRFVYQNPVPPPHLTHSREEATLYKKDLLIRRKMSVRLLSEVLSYMSKLEKISKLDWPFPVSILAAELEKVVDLKATKRFYQKLQSPRKEFKTFFGFYHEIFNEEKQEEAFAALKKSLVF